jgi:HEAT repeat protein/TolA-binding protein
MTKENVMTSIIRLLLLGAAIPTMAAAQRPPARPAPAAPPAHPAPVAIAAPVIEAPYIDPVEIRGRAEEARAMAMELAHVDMERMKFDTERMRLEAEDFRFHAIDAARFGAEQARLAMDVARVDLERMHIEPKFDFSFDRGFSAVARKADRLLDAKPRAAWLRSDPADSVYRLARESLNRGEYRRAAQLFNEVTRRFASSGYAQHSAYWEAFARYRLGTTEELKVALQILEGKGEFKFDPSGLSRESGTDVPSLRARILGTLASRGDRAASDALRQQAAVSGGCDREEVSVRAEALAALGQMDMNAALPTVRKVLANRDECTVELRRRALYLLGREAVEGRLPLMQDVARNDPDAGIRGEAWSLIGRVGGDQAIPMLEEALRTANDERTQRSAINALGNIDSERARVAVRAIIERADAPERVRYDAILTLGRTRNERMPTAEELAYLRQLYGKVEAQKLREAVLVAASRVPTAENQAFLMGIVRNQNESASLRSSALQRLVQHDSYKVNDIAKLYEIADARSLREQVLYALSRRNEPEAVDKMIDIARKDTDPQIRRTAISLLSRSKNPRAIQLLQEMIDK